MRLPLLPLRHRHDAEILRLALPAFGALVAEPLFLLADSAIVGHLGTAQLAGLGVAGTVLAGGVSLCIFLAYGTTARVARLLGAGDLKAALRSGVHGLWLALLLGVLLAIAAIIGAPLIIGLFGPAEEARGHAITYLRISALGLPAMLAILALTGVLRGLQDTRTPLLVAVGSNAANLLLNVLLVYGAGLGIAGSALGTALAQSGGAAAYLLVVVRAARHCGVSLSFDLAGVLGGFKASSPLVLRNLALRLVIALATVVAARLGSPELAAHQVAFAVWTFLSLALDAIAIAGQALVGRYLGANDRASARLATRRMVEWSVAIGCLLGASIIVARPLLPQLFTPDQQVQARLSDVLLVVAVLQPLAGWVFALDGVLIGAGDVRYIALAQAATALCFAPAAWLVLELDLGLVGLWCAIGLWMFARLAVMAARERGDAWTVTGALRA